MSLSWRGLSTDYGCSVAWSNSWQLGIWNIDFWEYGFSNENKIEDYNVKLTFVNDQIIIHIEEN